MNGARGIDASPVVAALLLSALPGAAFGGALDCTFTTLCSPQTDCQQHPGVPFHFDVTSDGLSFLAGDIAVVGTTLDHLAPPAYGALFQTSAEGTLLLTVTGAGAAVMTQQDVTPGGTIQSVSYFGICEPGA